MIPKFIWHRSFWEQTKRLQETYLISSQRKVISYTHSPPSIFQTTHSFHVHHHPPCQPAETCSWMNAASKHSQPFSRALSITAGLPVSTAGNPSLGCAVRLPPLEAASHQHLHWVSHLVWRSSLAAWLHFTCFLPSFIGHWSHLFMGQGSVFSHFSSLHCNLCLVY